MNISWLTKFFKNQEDEIDYVEFAKKENLINAEIIAYRIEDYQNNSNTLVITREELVRDILKVCDEFNLIITDK